MILKPDFLISLLSIHPNSLHNFKNISFVIKEMRFFFLFEILEMRDNLDDCTSRLISTFSHLRYYKLPHFHLADIARCAIQLAIVLQS